MKKTIYTLLVAFCLCACEVIHEDNRIIDLDPQLLPTNAKTHILIEYTGFTCVNCPNAAAEAHHLLDTYNNLIVVEMHPASNPFTQTKKEEFNYTCPAADIYYTYMGGTPTTSFPKGNLDFTLNSSGEYMSLYPEWSAMLASVSSDTTILDMGLQPTWNESTQSVDIQLDIMPKTTDTLECQVLFWVIEDHIIGAQSMPDGSSNMEYEHNHVLRTAIGDEWGQVCHLTGTTTTINTTCVWNNKWVKGNCQVVAVVLDSANKQVMHSCKANIK